jgi:hypothetical protein
MNQRKPSGPAGDVPRQKAEDMTAPANLALRQTTLDLRAPSRHDYAVSLDAPPLSWWRSRGESGPQRILPLDRKDCAIKCRDQTPRPGFMLETIYAAKPSRHVVEKFVFPQRVEPRNAERAWIDTRPHNLRRSAVRELASAAKNHAAARSIVTIILPIGCPLLR